MTRISNSPLKHKTGDSRAHMVGTIPVKEELYHEEFGGEVEEVKEV